MSAPENQANLGRNPSNLGRNPANLGRNPANLGRNSANLGEIHANAQSFETTLSEANAITAQMSAQIGNMTKNKIQEFQKAAAVATAVLQTVKAVANTPGANGQELLAKAIAAQPEINMTTTEVKSLIAKSIKEQINDLAVNGIINENRENVKALRKENSNLRAKLLSGLNNNGNPLTQTSINTIRKRLGNNNSEINVITTDQRLTSEQLGGRKSKKIVKKPTKKTVKKTNKK